jgi:hypothetical protein
MTSYEAEQRKAGAQKGWASQQSPGLCDPSRKQSTANTHQAADPSDAHLLIRAVQLIQYRCIGSSNSHPKGVQPSNSRSLGESAALYLDSTGSGLYLRSTPSPIGYCCLDNLERHEGRFLRGPGPCGWLGKSCLGRSCLHGRVTAPQGLAVCRMVSQVLVLAAEGPGESWVRRPISPPSGLGLSRPVLCLSRERDWADK